MKETIIYKIKRRSAKVAVFGLGRIGLPIATKLADLGFGVMGVDSVNQVLEAIEKREVSTSEICLNSLIHQAIASKHLKVTSSGTAAVKESDIVIICVPTPIRADKTPDYSCIENVCGTIASVLSKGKLIIVESTLPPRTTNDLIVPSLEGAKGLKCGLDFWLAYCPERLTPGNAIMDFMENDKIIGGFNSESSEVAAEFFKSFVKGHVLSTDATTAELVKLSENTFRDVNIAFANELALVCEQNGVDVLEVIRLANTHSRVNIHMPGPGVGGPCLPKDPYLLLHSSNPAPYDLIRVARQINDYMPQHVLKLVFHALEVAGKEIRDSQIAVLGTAYKADVDHASFSPSESIVRKLTNCVARIVVYDPCCNESFGAMKVDSLYEAVRGADCIIIVTDHKQFKNLNLQEVKSLMKDIPIIVDGKRVVNPRSALSMGFVYYGIGFQPHLSNK